MNHCRGTAITGIMYLCYYSEIKTYDPAVDSTLPKVSKKRKHEDDEEEVLKVPKIEEIDADGKPWDVM